MSRELLPIKEVDRVEVTTLMDNYVDILLPDTDYVKRPVFSKGEELPTDTLLAEHGLSLLITVYGDGNSHSVLLDTGHSSIGVPHNMEILGIEAEEIGTIVMSHAHMDHTGALYPLIERMPAGLNLVVHPYAFHFPRYVVHRDQKRMRFPRTLEREELEKKGVEIISSQSPTLIADEMILVSGEIERTTSFEKGMPNAFTELDGEYIKDPISDDQALIILLKDKGVVVISGCSHSGIINTIRFSKKVTGVKEVHAVLGGFHLTGPLYKDIIDPTINEMKELEPEVVVPMHCTGWNAIQKFSRVFQDAFILNSVGSKFILPDTP